MITAADAQRLARSFGRRFREREARHIRRRAAWAAASGRDSESLAEMRRQWVATGYDGEPQLPLRQPRPSVALALVVAA